MTDRLLRRPEIWIAGDNPQIAGVVESQLQRRDSADYEIKAFSGVKPEESNVNAPQRKEGVRHSS